MIAHKRDEWRLGGAASTVANLAAPSATGVPVGLIVASPTATSS